MSTAYVPVNAGSTSTASFRCGIDHHRCRCGLVPGDIGVTASVCRKIGAGQVTAGCRVNEERPGAPVAQKRFVVPALLDHHPGNAERQGAIAAGPHAQPLIRLYRAACPPRIDHDQFGAARLGGSRALRMDQPRGIGIMAPVNDAAGTFIIRRADPGPKV